MPGENDFERRVRESEQALQQQMLSTGKRPFTLRWWYFFVTTFFLWSQVIGGASDLLGGRPVERFGVVCAVTLAVMLPAFVWARRHWNRKREGAASRE